PTATSRRPDSRGPSPHGRTRALHRARGPTAEQGRFLADQLREVVHDGADARAGADVGVDDQPDVVVADGAREDAAQLGVNVAAETGQGADSKASRDGRGV